MIKILLVCAGGMSTSMLAKNMRSAADEKQIETEIWAVAESVALEEAKSADIILVGPQMRFKVPEFQKEFPQLPVQAIDMRDYGSMNGKAVLEKALAEVHA
ncbi:PTS system cellobiose-specific IIB component [Breznakia blatticola]|uniref:PTS system cellobiose-specific IIB component n=1 Tax=Breznakia blatticola TaxID=1754012 RepID=A0A4R7Z878_9FIRM|nr:PTS sugar transporter subunit IIB [Breznakia blatticola]TDW08415.1 PTS system cellobiose-specific IIB component [Breznakia blatticola]